MRPEIFLDRVEADRDTTRRHAQLNLVASPLGLLVSSLASWALLRAFWAISKQLVELHGGRLWVDSVERRGTTFHVLLPHRLG